MFVQSGGNAESGAVSNTHIVPFGCGQKSVHSESSENKEQQLGKQRALDVEVKRCQVDSSFFLCSNSHYFRSETSGEPLLMEACNKQKKKKLVFPPSTATSLGTLQKLTPAPKVLHCSFFIKRWIKHQRLFL